LQGGEGIYEIPVAQCGDKFILGNIYTCNWHYTVDPLYFRWVPGFVGSTIQEI